MRTDLPARSADGLASLTLEAAVLDGAGLVTGVSRFSFDSRSQAS